MEKKKFLSCIFPVSFLFLFLLFSVTDVVQLPFCCNYFMYSFLFCEWLPCRRSEPARPQEAAGISQHLHCPPHALIGPPAGPWCWAAVHLRAWHGPRSTSCPVSLAELSCPSTPLTPPPSPSLACFTSAMFLRAKLRVCTTSIMNYTRHVILNSLQSVWVTCQSERHWKLFSSYFRSKCRDAFVD